ncbi:hypothetical protein BC629DRAFT_788137 [Irpex lacteus]|nr:hypothetical protein BC629DRAFT_788137 [Irpex lacteus]
MQASDAIQESLWDIQVGKYFFLAGLSILLYDHATTFSQEVEVIWKRKKTYISWLFLLVRYYCMLAMIVVSIGYFSTAMTRDICRRWMLFLPLGVTVPLSFLPSVLMSIRVWAMYNGNRYLLGLLFLYLAAQTAAGLWQYTVPGGTPAPDPVDNYEYHFCIYLPPKSIGHNSILYVSMELAFDSLVFFLTISRTVCMYYYRGGSLVQSGSGSSRSRWSSGVKLHRRSLLESLVHDGALYFAAIFSINLTWVVMILHAPTGLRAIAAQPSACLMTTVICRITMNLRTTAYDSSIHPHSSLRNPAHSLETNGDIALARFYPDKIGENRHGGQTSGTQVSFQSNTDGEHLEILKPFSNGNGYGQYAYQHERVFKDV